MKESNSGVNNAIIGGGQSQRIAGQRFNESQTSKYSYNIEEEGELAAGMRKKSATIVPKGSSSYIEPADDNSISSIGVVAKNSQQQCSYLKH